MARKKTKDKFPNRDRWKSDGQIFYLFNNVGHDPDREHVRDRCWGALVGADGNDNLDDDLFMNSTPITDWKGAVFIVEPGMPMDDMPWVLGQVPVVSTRLRGVIESAAPGQAEFHPIRVKRAEWDMNLDTAELEIDEAGSDWLFDEGVYWAMNTLVEVDCMNWELAKDDPWLRAVIQTDRVPAHVVLFRIEGSAHMYCRRALREACDAAGVKGAQFRKVAYTPLGDP